MKIAIVGAGFTGISAAIELVKHHDVTVYEASDVPGGLAAGFQKPEWKWSVEKHYHHLFRSDQQIQQLCQQSGLHDILQFYSVNTSTRIDGQNFRLDSPISLLQFAPLNTMSKLRTGGTMAGLRFIPWRKEFDTISAKEFIIKTMGKQSWKTLWEPLFIGKFGSYANQINASWFWARIHVRSQQLGYPEGGFLHLSQKLVEYFQDLGGQIHFSSPITEIKYQQNTWHIEVSSKKKINTQKFDQVLVTGPHTLLHKLVPQLPLSYTKSLQDLQSLGAMTLVLELSHKFFKDNIYWLNINEKNWPFLAVVEHTNLASSKNYDQKHLVYIGKYLSPSEKMFTLNKEQILKLYHPYLKQLASDYKENLTDSWLFKEYYAQPIVGLNHYKNIPSITTPLSGLFWASMHHVYPWDRGTNYAVKLGKEAANIMTSSRKIIDEQTNLRS